MQTARGTAGEMASVGWSLNSHRSDCLRSGRRSVFIQCSGGWDAGACESPRKVGIPPVLMPAILVSHWGNSFDTTGLMSSEFPYSDKGPCYRPHHDIVIPPPQQHDLARSPLVGVDSCVPRMGPTTCPPPERDIVLFFAGKKEWGDDGKYSHGVRQRAFDLFAHEPAFKVQLFGTDEDLRKSVFCLAPSGLAFGDRLFQAIAYGCIPVVIQDNVTQVRIDTSPDTVRFSGLRSASEQELTSTAQCFYCLGDRDTESPPLGREIEPRSRPRLSLFSLFDAVARSAADPSRCVATPRVFVVVRWTAYHLKGYQNRLTFCAIG